MALILIRAVDWFAQLLLLLLAGRALMSWFVRGPYSPLYKIYEAVLRLTEPIVAPCRKISARFNTGMLDFSVLIAFLLVSLLRTVIIRLLYFIV